MNKMLSAVLSRLDLLLASPPVRMQNDDVVREKMEKLRIKLGALVEQQLRRISDVELRKELNKQVIDLAYEIEDLVESYGGEGIKHKHGLEEMIDELMLRINGLQGAEAKKAISTLAPAVRKGSSDHNNQYGSVLIEDYTEQLLGMFYKKQPELSTAVIYGMPGMGKTTLAHKVFNSVPAVSHFDRRAWASVGQVFRARDVLATILVSLSHDQSREQIRKMEVTELTAQLYKVQRGWSCLIILDDVWSAEAWDSMRFAFPLDASTTIIVTTRSEAVASQFNGQVLRVSSMADEASLELFLRQTGLQHSDIQNNPVIEGYVNKIVSACKGLLPLAVSVIAGILRTSKLEDWEKVMPDILQQVMPNSLKAGDIDGRMSKIMDLSYDHLPPHERPFLVYLGLFPYGRPILIETLYLLWMAEGLISTREMAEEIFSHLAERNLVMIKRNEEDSADTRLVSCELHDVIHDFCISRGQKENFFGTIDLSLRFKRTMLIPRVAVYLNGQPKSDGISSYVTDAKNIRSLLFFGKDESSVHKSKRPHTEGIELKDFHWTRVLEFDQIDFRVYDQLSQNIENLVYLRYLGFGGCYLDVLPLSYCNFLFMETLDLRVVASCKMTIQNVPWNMPNLRHLYFPQVFQVNSQNKLKLDTVTSLEVLENFHAGICDADDLSNLTHLKIFKGTADGNTEDFMKIIDFMDTSENLRESTVIFKNFDCYSKKRRGILRKSFRCPTIHKLHLHLEGHLKKMPEDLSFAQNLTNMVFDGSEFSEDPMEILGRFEQLQSLVLCNDAFVCKNIFCSDFSFPRLDSLKLANLRYFENWELEGDAMENLRVMTVEQCNKLLTLPAEYVYSEKLTELRIGSMPKTFEEKVREIGDKQLRNGNDLTLTFYDC